MTSLTNKSGRLRQAAQEYGIAQSPNLLSTSQQDCALICNSYMGASDIGGNQDFQITEFFMPQLLIKELWRYPSPPRFHLYSLSFPVFTHVNYIFCRSVINLSINTVHSECAKAPNCMREGGLEVGGISGLSINIFPSYLIFPSALHSS